LNKKEAAGLLERELELQRAIPSDELRKLVIARHIEVLAIDMPDRAYQIEIQYFWDGAPEGRIRVAAGIDDGGWSAWNPLCRDFIKAADGSFIDE
jgi:hypothetical protein